MKKLHVGAILVGGLFDYAVSGSSESDDKRGLRV